MCYPSNIFMIESWYQCTTSSGARESW